MKIAKLFEIYHLFKSEGIEASALKFGEVKTADGKYTLIHNGETIEVGHQMMIVDEAGTQLPAPEGEHSLEDGRIVVIEGKEGIVKEVKEKEAEKPEETKTTETTTTSAPEERMSKEEVSRIIEERVRKFEDEKKLEFEKQNSIIEGLFSLVKKISEQPASTPAKPTHTPEKKKFNAQDELKIMGDNLVTLLTKK